MNSRASRACNGCRVRKVKCNSSNPCSQCSHLGLSCVYSPVAKRKPGVRNRLVAQLRDRSNGGGGGGGGGSQTAFSYYVDGGAGRSAVSFPVPVPVPSAPAVTSIAGIVNADNNDDDRDNRDNRNNRNNSNNSNNRDNRDNNSNSNSNNFDLKPPPRDALYTPDFFLDLLPNYERQVYPVNPVITGDEVRAAVANMHADLDDAAFVYAYAAMTINLTTPTSWTLHSEIGAQITKLMRQSLRAHRCSESMPDSETGWFRKTPATFKRIMTCIFLEVSMMSFKLFDRGFGLLREAMAMIHMLHIQQYSHSAAPLEPFDVPKFQRLYWQVFIHERFITTLSGYPCIMTPLSTGLPLRDTTIPAHVDVGFNRLIRLFQIMDGPFLSYWNAQQNPSQPVPGVSPQWIERKHSQLDLDEAGAAEAEKALTASGRGSFTELQHTDLFVTRLWLRTLLWQFGLTHGFLLSAPPQNTHEGMSIHFPAHRVSVQLRGLVSRLRSVSSFVTHGASILQKVFEITSTVADVLALPLSYGQTQDEVRTRIEDFAFLVRFLFSFERAEKEQRDYLREKLEVLQQQYRIVDLVDLAGPTPDG